MRAVSAKLIFRIIVIVFLFIFFGCDAGEDPGPAVKAEWADWIKSNHYTIRSLEAEDTDYSDLRFLQAFLEGRSLVQLGESGHGVSEYSKAKVRLIKFLHEELGYDVIAFESSIFECYLADKNAAILPPEEIMGQSIFGVWHCEETLKLFEYIKETKQSTRPLIFAGFDVQTSSSWGAKKRPTLFKEAVEKIDSIYAQQVFDMDSIFIANLVNPSWPQSQGETFKLFYEELYIWFDENMSALEAAYTDSPLMPRILRQSAWSMIAFIDELISPGTESTNYRDKGMAENVRVLLQELYPGKKIMIWAHNFHILHNADEISSSQGIYNMGYWLVQWFREQMYTIGFFMYEGQAALNTRGVYDIGPAKPNSLEAIFYQTRKEYSFVDMLYQTYQPGTSWMFEEIPAKIWELEDMEEMEKMKMIPRNQFDAVFFIKTVHPPEYVTYYGSEILVPNEDFR